MSSAHRRPRQIAAIANLLFTCFYTCGLVFAVGYVLYVPIAREADRTKIGGDYEVAQWKEPIPYNLSSFMLFNAKNISRVEEASAIASHGRYNANVSIKGIDAQYPLYGSLQLLKGSRPYPFFYDPKEFVHGAVVDYHTIKALRLKIGDRFRVAKGNFEVTGVILSEPDPALGKMALLPRIIVSNNGFSDTQVFEDTPQKTLFRCRAILGPRNDLQDIKEHYSYLFHYPTWGWRNWDKSPAPN